jgi:hypothetical protein
MQNSYTLPGRRPNQRNIVIKRFRKGTVRGCGSGDANIGLTNSARRHWRFGLFWAGLWRRPLPASTSAMSSTTAVRRRHSRLSSTFSLGMIGTTPGPVHLVAVAGGLET